MRLLKLWLLVLLPLLGTSMVYGQGWKKQIPVPAGTNELFLHSVENTNNSGYVVCGTYADASWQNRIYVVRTDMNGNAIWTKDLGIGFGRDIRQTNDGGFIVSAYDFSNLSNLYKLDANGNVLWSIDLTGSGGEVRKVRELPTGDLLAILNNSLYKINGVTGAMIWTKLLSFGNADIEDLTMLSTGDYLLTSRKNIGGGFYPMFIKTDNNGDTVWTKTYEINPSYGYDSRSACTELSNGDYMMYSTLDSSLLMRTNTNGDTVWTKLAKPFRLMEAYDVENTIDQNMVLAGREYSSFSSSTQLRKLDLLGNIIWERELGASHRAIATDVELTTDSGYIVTIVDSFNLGGNYLVKTDSLGNAYTNTIQGNVFQDNNTDCTNNLGDISLPSLIIKATPLDPTNPDIYTTTDSLGNYSIVVDSGTYTITIESPLPYYNFTCQSNGVTINFPGFYQPVQTVDFALEPTFQCPLMQVDISAPFIRQTGGGSYYTISYCNTGTDSAYNAYVEVDFDASLTIIGTSIPSSSQNGNFYTFDLGNIGLGECGSFQVQVIADSTALVGKAICSDVYIYPDSVCIPNYWNGAILRAGGTCSNDTVTFTILNKGAPMTQGTQYFVYEDNIIFRTGTTNALGAGATQQIQEHAGLGKTYRLEVKQEVGFPALLGDSTATAVVEGCNPYPNGTFNTGFVTNLSNGSSSPFIAIDCQPLIASYDPNDKSAQPEGYNAPHYIYNYTALDYKVRFQNTGTDTAFRVVIRDTLSAHLDVASIQMGASSHNYTWRVYGNGILEITFDNIMLPDSNVNELASNGFVRFRIDQTPNNVDGTVIYNDAAIYFDYNAPIITNETFHTIGSGFVTTMLITGTEKILVAQDVQVKVYPNPFKDQATLEVVGGDYQEVQLTVYDITGRDVLQYISTSEDHKIAIQRNNLPSGVYIYRLAGDGELINTGKMIID